MWEPRDAKREMRSGELREMESDPPMGGADETRGRRRCDLRWAREPDMTRERENPKPVEPVTHDPWGPDPPWSATGTEIRRWRSSGGIQELEPATCEPRKSENPWLWLVRPATRQTREEDPVLQSDFRRLFRRNQWLFPADLLRKIPKVYKSYNFVDWFDYGGIRVICFWGFCSAVCDACVFWI
jgi:hypothetical protein